MFFKPLALAITLFLFGIVLVDGVRASIVTVGEFDENDVQVNSVDVSVTPYTAVQMKSDVANAFSDGLGGVINFDNGTIQNPNRIEALFSGGSKTLNIRNDTREWEIGFLGTGTAGALSGDSVLFNGAPDPFPTPFLNRVIFDDITDGLGTSTGEVVTTFGLIVLDDNPILNGGENDTEFTVTFSDDSTTSVMHTLPGSINTDDAFFGFKAPEGLFIKQVDIVATNNLATDDWAFIVSPTAIPEPSSFMLLGMLSSTVLLRCRRR